MKVEHIFSVLRNYLRENEIIKIYIYSKIKKERTENYETHEIVSTWI